MQGHIFFEMCCISVEDNFSPVKSHAIYVWDNYIFYHCHHHYYNAASVFCVITRDMCMVIHIHVYHCDTITEDVHECSQPRRQVFYNNYTNSLYSFLALFVLLTRCSWIIGW